ncbi:MAG: hypothetical protein JKY37_15240 [Nannocystaceae bacterium]|nr:hypothetical protein [Nannocystaceae bacterium]
MVPTDREPASTEVDSPEVTQRDLASQVDSAPRGRARLLATCFGIGNPDEGLLPVNVLVRQILRRLVAWVLLAVLIWILVPTPDPRELLSAVQHGSFAFMAVISAGWVAFLVPAALLAAIWLAVYTRPGAASLAGGLPRFGRRVLTLSNRVVLHLTAGLFVLFSAATASTLWWCLIVATMYFILARKVLHWLTLRLVQTDLVRPIFRNATIGVGEALYFEHLFLPIITMALFGYLWLLGRSLDGLRGLLWLVGVACARHVVFFFVWLFRSILGQAKMGDGDRSVRNSYREAAARASRWEVLPVLVCLLVSGALPYASILTANKAARAALLDRLERENPEHDCLAMAEIEHADLALFLVADNQFRTLNGKTSIAHSRIIRDLVPVAVRPVELDLLSVASLDHFARMYRAMQDHAATNGLPVKFRWAHLGDFGDLACRSELGRFPSRIRCFGAETMLGFAPGNHDSFYTGNFGWHPDWSGEQGGACAAGGPVTRGDPTGLRKSMTDALGQCPLLTGRRSTANDGDFFASTAYLGEVGHHSLAAVFFDTSDFAGTSFGAAGVQGEISRTQKRWILRQVDKLPEDTLFVFFMHHPYESLSWFGRRRVDEIAEGLGARLVAVVSAHTHQSQFREAEVAGRMVPHFVVGSTTDPPQEAALLTFRHRDNGTPELHFRTIPAVARSGAACGEHTVMAEQCAAVLEKLSGVQECQALLSLGSSHSDGVSLSHGEQTSSRARALFACTQRVTGQGEATLQKPWGGEVPPNHHVDPYSAYRDTCTADGPDGLNSPERHQELVCLSWVASTLQGLDETEGWTFGRASRVAFERLAANGAWAIDVPSN